MTGDATKMRFTTTILSSFLDWPLYKLLEEMSDEQIYLAELKQETTTPCGDESDRERKDQT